MERKTGEPQPEVLRLSSWTEILEYLSGFSPPETSIDLEGSVAAATWAFRGLRDSSYELEPSIEREASDKSMGWAALEELVSTEFKARARSHLSPSLIPEDELTWLAQMQHYAITTRLLDFTYSPFVALYFAIRDGAASANRTHVRLWAINAEEVNRRFRAATWNASFEDRRRKGSYRPSVVSLDTDDFATDRDSIVDETAGLQTAIADALSATGTFRGELNRIGCTCMAPPPSFNPRLVSQQGLFLLNFAEDLSLGESLKKMMAQSSDWRRACDIPVGLTREIERHLFQMNIHEQSLFPDMHGLAGFIRQRTRLHWR
ncbi:MAG: FRG domain-containing protein [Acidobacteria bacterium]|nr:FRG domain-containing protein [Acidobacteriota bacterium]